MQKLLLAALGLSLLLVSCDNYGKRVKINDKNEVYYNGDGVSESDAKSLGDFLLKSGLLDPSKDESIQLMKNGNDYQVKIVYDKDFLQKNKQYLLTFWSFQYAISENVFHGSPVRILFTDNHFKEYQTVDAVNKVEIDKSNTVYYRGNDITGSKAKEMGTQLMKEEFMPYTNGKIFITKDKDEYSIGFPASAQKMQEGEEKYYGVLKNWQYLLTKYILKEPVKLFVLGADYSPTKQFDDPTADEKMALDKAMLGVQPNEPVTQPGGTQISTADSTNGNK